MLGSRHEKIRVVKLRKTITGVDTVEVPVLGDREIMHPPVGHYPAVVLASPVTSKPFMVELDTAVRKI
ncbi:MAG: hypothetical protein U7126_02055 [Microcoleus sp.]